MVRGSDRVKGLIDVEKQPMRKDAVFGCLEELK